MTLIELRNVNKVYDRGKTIALHGINLVIEKGDFTALFGPSGSGKTTLLNLMSLVDKPSGGEILFAGNNLSTLKRKDLDQYKNNNIGYIPRSNKFLSDETVYQNLVYTARVIYKNKNKDKDKIKNSVFKVLNDVGLNGLETRKPEELDYKQKKRLAIAMAIIKEAELVLVDEPSNGLDSKTADEIMEIMVDMNKELGTTVIFTTKDIQIIDYAYRTIGIEDGIITDNQKEESEMLLFGLLGALLSCRSF